jgi:hypothetical protein
MGSLRGTARKGRPERATRGISDEMVMRSDLRV